MHANSDDVIIFDVKKFSELLYSIYIREKKVIFFEQCNNKAFVRKILKCYCFYYLFLLLYFMLCFVDFANADFRV